MTEPSGIRDAVIDAILGVAADASREDISEDGDLRDELDLDSMDVLNIVTAVHDRLGVQIPQVDYPKIATLATFVGYLEDKLAAGC